MLVTGVLTSIVTARYLGPSGRGVLALALLALGVLLLVADLGMSASITYFVSGGRLKRNEALRFCTLTALGLGAGAYLVSLALFPLVDGNLMRGVSFAIYSFALAAILPMLFVTFWTRLKMASGEFKGPALTQTLVAAGTVVIAIVVLLVARRDVREFVMALTALHTLVAAGAFFAELRQHGFSRTLPHGFAREATSYGLRSYMGSLVSYATLRIDAFILNAFGTNADVGRYTVAVTLGEKLWLLDSSLGQATMPHVVSRERREAAELVASANRMVVLIATVAAGVLFALAPWLITTLYGSAFQEAALPLRILLPGIVLYASGRLLLQYHQGQLGRPGAASLVMGASAAVGIALYLLLIPARGMAGAAWASTAAYATVFIGGLGLFQRESHVGLLDTLVPKPRDAVRLGQLLLSAFSRKVSSSTDTTLG